jgi:integrase-like protein
MITIPGFGDHVQADWPITINGMRKIAFRKRIYSSIEQLQADLDVWIATYNEQRPHQGRWCYGKTPLLTFVDTIPLAREKMLNAA